MANRESPAGIIDITSAIGVGQVATVTNRLSAFELVGVAVYGSNGAIATVKKGASTAAIAYYVAGPPVTQGCSIVNAQTSFSTSDTLTITGSGAAITRVVLHVRYPDAYAGTLTVTVV